MRKKTISEFVSPKEASKRLEVSADTLRRWEAVGKIKAIRTPTGHRRYDMTSLVTSNKEAQTFERWIVIGEDTLQQLAKGLCEYEQQVPKKSLSNYPVVLELGVNKLALACLLAGVRQPIQGVSDFVSRWAQLRIKEWGIEVVCPEEWQEKRLIEGQKPSEFCIETAGEYFEECGNFQQKVINEVMIKAAQKPDLYTKFRCYPIENPVITKGKLEVEALLILSQCKTFLGIAMRKLQNHIKEMGNSTAVVIVAV